MLIDGKELHRIARKRARREALRKNGRKMTTIVMDENRKNSCRDMKHKKNWIHEHAEDQGR